ncbi:solute carrier family 49 member 4 isoform X2 [Rhineura floridana]|uniref:solute carrier family 49 member 4 isoform X2 n=1 Tax=Rhineura floridana TaxID=261503 RepID=UPI002AC84C17|nr:solute carrier family 49 member 4 isoform X2 [Rhineura floridana]
MGSEWSSPEEREPLLQPPPPTLPQQYPPHGQSRRTAVGPQAAPRGQVLRPVGPPRLSPVPGRVYGRRWLVLLLFSLLGFVQGLVWNTWGPIQNSARQAFAFSSLDIALLVFWGPIGFVPCFAFMWLMDKKDVSDAIRPLNQCLAAIQQWTNKNKLKVNPEKTEVLLIGHKPSHEFKNVLILDGVPLPLKSQVRSLGILLDSALTLEPQIATVSRSAFTQLKLVRQLRPFLGTSDLRQVTQALATSRLDYCNALYIGLSARSLRPLKLVQRAAARMLTGAGLQMHTTPLLYQLHWLPILFRHQFKILVLAFKALHGLAPIYLSNRILEFKSQRPTRVPFKHSLIIPSTFVIRRSNTRNKAFSCIAPILWNNLPPEIRCSSSLTVFRRQLKTFLFLQAFNVNI